MSAPMLQPEAAALVVVDIQNGFVNEKSDRALPPIVRLIERWRALDAPIYFTKFLNLPGSKWENLIGWKRLRTTPEVDFHESVARFVNDGYLVEKHNLYTSVTGKLKADLDSGAIRDVVICGIATESCVLATALAL